MIDEYDKVSKIGDGAFGSCFLCRRLRDDKMVVLKKAPITDSSMNEARFLAVLIHPNIVSMYNTYNSTRSCYIVLEYLEGGNLEMLIRKHREKPLRDKIIYSYLKQLNNALIFIHSNKIIHRDVKPNNILLNAGYEMLKLADFGISIQLFADELRIRGRMGTSNYMSPEMLEGREYDFRCDIWAMGCVLYELVERKRAFDGSSDIAIFHKICSGNYALPKSSKFCSLILQLLNSSSYNRINSSEFGLMLEEFAKDLKIKS